MLTERAWFNHLYDIRPGNRVDLFSQPRSPHRVYEREHLQDTAVSNLEWMFGAASAAESTAADRPRRRVYERCCSWWQSVLLAGTAFGFCQSTQHMKTHASGCVARCRICNQDVAGSNLSKHQGLLSLPSSRAGIAHSACRWNSGCAGKTVIPWKCVLYLSTLSDTSLWRHYTNWLSLHSHYLSHSRI